MRTSFDRPRAARRAGLGVFSLAALVVLLAGAPHVAAAKEWDSPEYNVLLSIPDAPAPWEWLDFNPEWPKLGIVKGAHRTLTKLKRTGEPADGHGALMHLAVVDAKEGMTLADAAQDTKVRDFLLARFKGSEGEVEQDEFTIDSGTNPEGHPAVVLRTSGTAFNLKAKQAACTGYLVLAVARGKIVMMRMYAFPTDDDDDGLVFDLDYLEANCLRLINTKEDVKAKPPPNVEEGKENGEGAEEMPTENAEDEVIENPAQRWRMVLDKKLMRVEISEEDRKTFFLELKCEGVDRMGGYQLLIYAPPTTQYIDGQKVPPPNIVKWIGPSWWKDFTISHTKGELATFKWPRKPATKGAKTFLTLPDFGDEDARIVVFKADDKRPAEMDASEMRKHGFFEKVKDNNLGRRGKGVEAVRGIMQGKHPNFPGLSTVVRFGFRSPSHSYRVFVTLWGEAHKRWGDALRRTLESWEFGLKFKD